MLKDVCQHLSVINIAIIAMITIISEIAEPIINGRKH